MGELARMRSSLMSRIEALTNNHPLFGDNAITPRGTAYVTIVNGHAKEEAEKGFPPCMPAAWIVDDAFEQAKKLRDQIEGPAYVVWRATPRVERDGSLYMRLCFEPV